MREIGVKNGIKFHVWENVGITRSSKIRNEGDSGETQAHNLEHKLMCLKDLVDKQKW